MSYTTYFAVETKRGETSHEVANLVITSATKLGLTFKALEAMGSVTVGAVNFTRFRTDLRGHEALLDALGRGTIAMRDGACRVILTGGRQGAYPSQRLFTAPLTGTSRVYRGPGQPHAERQFSN